jgi:cellulose synthase/poly-beta-1,6-N-acetylglucosamine synthase-like glycosyltransferase
VTLFIIAGLVVVQGVLVIWFTTALWQWKRKLIEDSCTPPAAVILCLRGPDPFLAECLKGLSQQDYPDFQIHVIIDHPNDEAREIFDAFHDECLRSSHEASQKFVQRTRVHFLESPFSTCSLKCSSLLQVIKSLDSETEFIAQLDADAIPHPTWLRELATALQDDDVGAATGNRWYMPSDPSLPALIRYGWNAAAVVQMFCYRIPWGGTLAVRTALLQDDALLSKWQNAFCEDTPLFSYLRSRQLRVAFVPSLLMINRENCTLEGFFRWVRRQLLTTRLHHPAWPMVVLHGTTTTLFPLLSAGLLVVALATRNYEVGFNSFLGLVVYGVGMLGLLIPMEMAVRRIIRGRGQDASWTSPIVLAKIILAIPLTMLVYALALASTSVLKRTEWRRIEYEIRSGKQVRMLGYRPYAPSADSSESLSL